MSEYDVDAGGLSERVEAEKPGASSLPLARTPRSENPPDRLSGEGGVKESSPGARSADVTSGAERTRVEAPSTSPPAESRSRKKKGCSAHAPAGTRCKICGQVHPQREGKSLKIHVPGADLEAKEDFK